jgi:hypothetical protein
MAERKGKGGAARKEEVVTREYTINLHKRLHGWYLTYPHPSRHHRAVPGCHRVLIDLVRSPGSASRGCSRC